MSFCSVFQYSPGSTHSMPGRELSAMAPCPPPEQQQVSRALFNSWMLGSRDSPFAQTELYLSLCS